MSFRYDEAVSDPFKPGSGTQFAKLLQEERGAGSEAAAAGSRQSGGAAQAEASRSRKENRMVSKAKARTRAQAQSTAPTRLNVAQAYIRIRPLLSHELAAGETVLPGLVVEGNCPLRPEEEQTAGTMTTTNVGVNALNSKTTPIGGFTGVLGDLGRSRSSRGKRNEKLKNSYIFNGET